MKVLVNEIENGMVLDESIYSDTGVLLLERGTVLTQKIIMSLDRLQREHVEIYERPIEGDRFKINLGYADKYNASVLKFKEIYQSIKISHHIPYMKIEKIMDDVYTDVLNSEALATKVWLLDQYDFYTFEHCVRVCIFSGLIAKWMQLSEAMIKDCILAGLLHDLGKMNIPDEILNKPGKLTEEEYEVMQTHPQFGYSLLLGIEVLSKDVKEAVLMHHERNDGSGYPSGFDGSALSLVTKIITVADVFCAMTSDRVYKKAQPPFNVVEQIKKESFTSLDYEVCKVFSHHILQLYVGDIIILSDGQVGEVIFINEEMPSKPLIKVGNKLYDLSEIESLKIEKSLSHS